MPRQRPIVHRAVTRLEVLVLVLVMTVGLGLLLVWVSSRRATTDGGLECKNNLRQLAIALHYYHDTNNCFPTENGSNPSLFHSLLSYTDWGNRDEAIAGVAPVKLYLCPNRRTRARESGKRDYGYAATRGAGSAGTSILDAPSGVSLPDIQDLNGTSNTALLSHVWMDPAYYTGGDPTDLGYLTKNNSRSINDTAKRDDDPSGSTSHIGGPHPNVLPTLFADGHVQNMPYTFPYWARMWAYDNKEPFPLP